MKTIKVTEQQSGEAVFILTNHVVAIGTFKGGTVIFTTAHTFQVRESVTEVQSSLNANN